MTTTRENQDSDQTWLWDTGRYEPTGEMLLPYGEEIVRRAEPRPGEHALDIGTGTGNLALLCAEAGARTTGLDLATRLLGVARDRARARGVAPTWLQADAQAMPLLDGDVDVAVSCSALVLVLGAQRSAAELVRVLRSGGRAVIGGWDWETNPWFAADAESRFRDVFSASSMGQVMTEDPGWFTEDGVRRLFADLPVDIGIDRMPFTMARADSAEELTRRFFSEHPVATEARQRLGGAEWQQVQDEMAEHMVQQAVTDEAGTAFEQTALITSITRH